MIKEKVIVVCGPTATGKSDYAVKLAKKIKSEIISADSRQVYKGLDIGSGKITKKEMKGVPHHLLDVADPKRVFSVSQFQKKAKSAVQDILNRNKKVIVCGGTGFYIDAIVCDIAFPAVKPNLKLRKELSRESLEKLQNKLKRLDKRRFELVDKNNKVRLIRAIEIATELGKVPELKRKFSFDVEWHYLDFPDDVLKKRIRDRLIKRIKLGMVLEVLKLHQKGLPWKRLEALGLEYRYIALYLQKKLTKDEMLIQLESAIWQYAKRQRTWFKKYAIKDTKDI